MVDRPHEKEGGGMNLSSTPLTQALGIEVPLICGAMYPCSNPELVAAVSEAGGIGIVQPMTLTYVCGWDFRKGLSHIRSLTDRPIGVNLIIEQSSKVYLKRCEEWLDISLEEGITFFVTALGKPDWVVRRAHPEGAIVYHDVTARKWAERALDGGVDGFICVTNRAGGHAGDQTSDQLFEDIQPLGKPMVCAGGVGDEETFVRVIKRGFAGAQLGTRFIATNECHSHTDYKQAIIDAQAEDIVLTERITGVPVSIIKTPYIEKTGTRAGPLARWLLRGNKTKHWARAWYSLKSFWSLKRASVRGMSYKDYFQAGKSVEGIQSVEPAGDIVRSYAQALSEQASKSSIPD
ncbi:MAG: nitronate monooxygenase [Planctomycetota bacterium]|jgi:nitronate monooxygenase|nr:nitronate monooxygenase [Planctomycetota bacterium]